MAMRMDAVEDICGGEGDGLVHLVQGLCRGGPVESRAANPPVPARACRRLTASRRGGGVGLLMSATGLPEQS
jgi:hypothetical protein